MIRVKGRGRGEEEEEEEEEVHGAVFFITREEEKRREVVTGNVYGTYTCSEANSEAVAHGRYFEVPTFNRWSFSLCLTLSTHPRSSLSSPRISLLPSFAFNHARILSLRSPPPPFNIHAGNVFASLLFFGSNPIVRTRSVSFPLQFPSTRGFFTWPLISSLF